MNFRTISLLLVMLANALETVINQIPSLSSYFSPSRRRRDQETNVFRPSRSFSHQAPRDSSDDPPWMTICSTVRSSFHAAIWHIYAIASRTLIQAFEIFSGLPVRSAFSYRTTASLMIDTPSHRSWVLVTISTPLPFKKGRWLRLLIQNHRCPRQKASPDSRMI